MFKKNDITFLLQNSSNALGVFNQLNWESKFENDSTSNQSKLTTIHESYHNELNNVSLYGNLMQVFAILSNVSPTCKLVLSALVNQCKKSHEIYATCMSCWLINQTLKKDVSQSKLLLQNSNEYILYYELGDRLTKDFKGAFLKEQCLSAIMYFIFNRRTITEKVLSEGLLDFKTNKIRGKYYPDQILKRLIKEVPDNFFLTKWIEFKEINKHNKSIEVFQKTEFDIDSYIMAIDKENDLLSKSLVVFFYNALDTLFPDLETISIDSKKKYSYLKKLIELGEKEFPDSKIKQKLIVNEKPEDDERNVFLNFHSERLINTENKLSATILFLKEINAEKWNDLSVGPNDKKHIFLISRTKESLIEQYNMSNDDINTLKNLNSEIVVGIRRTVKYKEKRIVELIIFKKPVELNQFCINKLSNVSILINLSFLTLYHDKWCREWGAIISKYCIPTTLVDLPLFNRFEGHFNNYSKVFYEVVRLNIEGELKTSIIFLGYDEIKYTVYILPCSEIVAISVIHFIIHSLDKKKYTELDKKLLSTFSDLIIFNLSHLFREESYFDLNTI